MTAALDFEQKGANNAAEMLVAFFDWMVHNLIGDVAKPSRL